MVIQQPAAPVHVLPRQTSCTRFGNTGFEAISSTPEAMAGYIASETRRWERVVREAHITAD